MIVLKFEESVEVLQLRDKTLILALGFILVINFVVLIDKPIYYSVMAGIIIKDNVYKFQDLLRNEEA